MTGVRIDQKHGKAFVECDRTRLTPERLILALQAAGFKATLSD